VYCRKSSKARLQNKLLQGYAPKYNLGSLLYKHKRNPLKKKKEEDDKTDKG
jgi:hypothetical protein